MRSAATFRNDPISARLRAAILLAVILIHLAFMASPLHAWVATQESHAVDTLIVSASDVTAALDEWTTRGRHAGHCILEWLKLDQRTTLTMHLAAALAAALLAPHLLVPGMRPIARAIGPPEAGDPQALLQVFRL